MHQIMMERFRVKPQPADVGLRSAIEAIGFSFTKRMQIIEDGTALDPHRAARNRSRRPRSTTSAR
jgi:hypothetical protein